MRTALSTTASAHRRGVRLSSSWLSAPAVLGVAVLFLAPVATFLFYSLLTGTLYSFSAQAPLTLENLTSLVGDATTRALARNSLIVGAIVSATVLAIAIPVAYWLRYFAGRWQKLALALIVLTFFSSYLVRIYAWRTILGENGVLNDTLERIGLIDEPLQILLYSRFSVIVSLVHIITPIAVLILFAGLRPLDARYLECAQDLGAGAVLRWRRVLLPLIAVPIASAGMLAFIMASADYVTPQMLGGPGQAMVGVEIQTQLKSLGDYPAGAALAVMALSAYAVLYGLIGLGLRLLKLNKIEWGT